MKIVGIISENSVEYIETILNNWSLNITVALIDWRIPEGQIISILDEIGIKKIYVDELLMEKYKFIEKLYETEILRHIKSVELVPLRLYKKFNDIINKGMLQDALILFSSGTTGMSKGIKMPLSSILYNAKSIIDYWDVNPQTSILVTKSFVHSSTIVGEILVGLILNVPLYIASSMLSPCQIFEVLNFYKINTYCINPTMLYLLIKTAKLHKVVLGELQYIYVSGSICNENIMQEAISVFKDIKVLNVYGVTELGPRVTAQRHDTLQKIGSVGTAINGVKICIVNNKIELASSFQIGLIHVSTPSIMSGYCINNVLRHSLYKDWFNTGDLGFLDNEENLYIVGRSDNMIISSGHNIFPEQIEQRIESIDIIDECIVYGVEDILYGQKLLCVYTSSEKKNFKSSDELVNLCKDKLATYEIPRKFFRVESLPKVGSGKKDRKNVDNYARNKCCYTSI